MRMSAREGNRVHRGGGGMHLSVLVDVLRLKSY